MKRTRQSFVQVVSMTLLICGSAAASPDAEPADQDQAETAIAPTGLESIKPAPVAPIQKTKKPERSGPEVQPQKRRRFRRCKLGDFDCYESASPRLAGRVDHVSLPASVNDGRGANPSHALS